MAPWQLIILFAGCFAGGITIFFTKGNNTRRLKLILSFSGAYLFAITILHLIPEVYIEGDRYIGLFVLGGFLFQVLLEQYSQGIEHGHMHSHPHGHHSFPFGIILSLCLHALLEGMPLSGGHRNELVFGIALHHVPAAFALGSLLLERHISRKSILVIIFVFALMTPAGYLLSNLISNSSSVTISAYFPRMMGIVIGIFLHISTTILFESSVDHHFNRKKLLAVLAGTAIALLSFLV
ncbi:ZIP family metal transporter [Hufsiella ginkgonis]|uniref:ZIP family metal transporter n=1 Tax=Hufsiella ginkgonis TaxID=2695274 RepID=A0A7K1XZ88_9SPHI|nr:ZIP family metal transporter [Hufsiella ginkgonis]MXV15866.1 ZIP family metal transporter [Hufsiella ginkgonis]